MNGSASLAQGVRETASALGMDPTDLATIISYETKGTFDPTKRGPTTQWGQHRGLIQFGEPQARQYGVDWDNPESSQLGADGAIVRYFRQSGWKPGMGLLDAYSIVNAGGPGLYNRSDANNGGAPGTVADKVRNQMGGHRQNALRLLGSDPQATVSTKGTAPMMQQEEEKPRGFLGGLGVQKMQEGAEGETGQRFFQRDSFKDTAALLAQGFGRMGIMGMEEIADGIAKQRTEAKAKNKTMEMLRKMPNGEELVKLAEVAGPKAVAEYVLAQRFAKPKDDRTAAMQNFSEYQRILAEQGKEAADQFRAMSGGQTFNLGDQVDAEGKLREKLMSKQGENFASYLDAGAKSAAAMQDLNVLQELTPLAPSGPVVGRLAEMFPEATDVAAVRQSIIKRVAPTLRVEGSGATSDLEFNAMLNSLGSLRNSPEANQAIIGVMQAKARYNMQRRKIINSYMTDGATLAETNNALAELDVNSKIPAAVQSILSTHGAGGEGVEAGVPSQGGPAIGTVNNGFRFKGGDPNNKNNWEPI